MLTRASLMCILLCFLPLPVMAAATSSVTEAEEDDPEASLGSLLPESGPVRTETRKVEVVAEEEFNRAIRRLPQLVEKIRIERLAADSRFVLLPHRPNYVLPLTWQSSPSDREVDKLLQNITGNPTASRGDEGNDHLEAVFQLSIKYQLASDIIGKHSRIDVAYTNRSFWQAYNEDISRPFRETNHEPELIFSWQTRNKYVDYFSLALNHQSNGQTSSLSRSWNRVIFEAGSVTRQGIISAKLWWRMPEKSGADPLDPTDDDNPRIEHYMGPGELRYLYPYGQHNLTVMLRNNFKWDDNRGAIELGWTFPLTPRIKGYVHYFNGYGESLIDYDRHQQRFGVGVSLSDWL
ncbi:phospholipase [Venatoribacter cucullus]|uniref:Phospholipase A1 n=1 Tax=Venatoribacter cucullus TaxID=2661630 RepID=A0A9X7UXG7_9GAMM|nr:phospholipase A [Venatoribacter cucullus]QQD23841.1 phospholipase [Venatoribacter cucullus]